MSWLFRVLDIETIPDESVWSPGTPTYKVCPNTDIGRFGAVGVEAVEPFPLPRPIEWSPSATWTSSSTRRPSPDTASTSATPSVGGRPILKAPTSRRRSSCDIAEDRHGHLAVELDHHRLGQFFARHVGRGGDFLGGVRGRVRNRRRTSLDGCPGTL